MKLYVRSSTSIEIGEYDKTDRDQVKMVQDLQTRDVTKFGNAYRIELYRLTKAYQTLKPQYNEVCSALKRIFSEYGLEVTDKFIDFTVYPEGWPWPYKYCKTIHFGEFKIEPSDILVPASYLDGINTTLPQSVIDSAVKACKRPLDIMNSYANSWPTSWPDGYLNSKFIITFANYGLDIVKDINNEYNLYMNTPALPTASSLVTFTDTESNEIVFETKYGTFLKLMRQLATTSNTRDEFAQKYSDYLQTMM